MKKVLFILVLILFAIKGIAQDSLIHVVIFASLDESGQIRNVTASMQKTKEGPNFFVSDSVDIAQEVLIREYTADKNTKVLRVLKVNQSDQRYLRYALFTSGKYMFNPKLIHLFGNNKIKLRRKFKEKTFHLIEKPTFEGELDIYRWLKGMKHEKVRGIYELKDGKLILIGYEGED